MRVIPGYAPSVQEWIRQVANAWASGPTNYIYNDGTNVRFVLPSTGGVAIRNSADSASLVSFTDSGSGGIVNAEGSGGKFEVNGVQVVASRFTRPVTPALSDVIACLDHHGLWA